MYAINNTEWEMAW